MTFGAVRAELLARPLRLSVWRDDRLLLTLNGRGLLKYEHYRKKQRWVDNNVRYPTAGLVVFSVFS